MLKLNPKHRLRRDARRGVSLIYTTILMIVMCAFASLAVDLGRVQVAKTELQRGADAAARYGAIGLATSGTQARTNAKDAADDNLCDGTAIILTNADIEFGKWQSNAFKSTSINAAGNNAVRITAQRLNARSSAVPLMFGAVLGVRQIDVKATSTAYLTSAVDVDQSIPASGNPWLAGMPNGTLANPNPPPSGVRRDRAGSYTDPKGVLHPTGESPAEITGINLIPGDQLTFDSIQGSAQHGPTQTTSGPDGNTGDILSNDAGPENGMSNCTGPGDSIVGVFLDDNAPNTEGAPPANLDFSSSASREFSTLSPQLRQVFFIGDGAMSNGTKQKFTIPTGATRLFIGKQDGYEWNNNTGASTLTIHRPPTISLVK